jgi:hypothetical protein
LAGAAPQEGRRVVHRVYQGRALSLSLQGETLRRTGPHTFEFTGLEGTLYTDPGPGRTDARRIDVRSAAGSYDESARLLKLRGAARMRTEDGDELTAEELVVDRAVRVEGRTLNTLRAPGRFELKAPLQRMEVTGEGFTADLESDSRFRNISVERAGRITLSVVPPRASATAPPQTVTTTVQTPGTMRLAPEPAALARLRLLEQIDSSMAPLAARIPPPLILDLPDGCEMERVAGAGDAPPQRSRLSAARARFTLIEAPVPRDPNRRQAQIDSLSAAGAVLLSGGEGEQAQCERLLWRRAGGETTLERGTSRVLIQQRDSLIHADRVRVDHAAGATTCAGNVEATLRPRPDAEPTHVRSDTLELRSAGATAAPTGGPSLGLEPGPLAIRSARAAVLEMGRIRVEAPTIAYDTRAGTAVVGGPKLFTVAPPDGAAAPLKITCAGTAVMDRPARQIQLEQQVRIDGPAFSMEAERARLVMDAGGRMERLLARGNVTLRPAAAGPTVVCDTIDYDPTTERMVVRGNPRAAIHTAAGDLLCEEAVINTKDGTLWTRSAREPDRIIIRLNRPPNARRP